MWEKLESRVLKLPFLEGIVLFLLSLWKSVNEWIVWAVSWPFHTTSFLSDWMFGFDRRLSSLLAHCDSLMFPSPSDTECEEIRETHEIEGAEGTEGFEGAESKEKDARDESNEGNATNKRTELGDTLEFSLAFCAVPSSLIKLVLSSIRLVLFTFGKMLTICRYVHMMLAGQFLLLLGNIDARLSSLKRRILRRQHRRTRATEKNGKK